MEAVRPVTDLLIRQYLSDSTARGDRCPHLDTWGEFACIGPLQILFSPHVVKRGGLRTSQLYFHHLLLELNLMVSDPGSSSWKRRPFKPFFIRLKRKEVGH